MHIYNIILKQIVPHKGIPFEVKIPTLKHIDISDYSENQLNDELEKGYIDVKTGRVKDAKTLLLNECTQRED